MGIKRFGLQIFMVVFGALILLAYHFIRTGYTNHLKVAQQGALATLDGIVSTLVSQIDGDTLEAVFAEFPLEAFDTIPFESKSLEKLNELLAAVQELNHLSTPIYTLTQKGLSNTFYVGAASNGYEPYGFPYTTPPKALLNAYAHGGTIPPFEDEHGSWLSAIHPITNSSGKQIAALQVDYPLDEFIMYAEDDAVKNICFTAILLSVVGLILFSVLRRIIRQEELSKHNLEQAKNEIAEKNAEVTSSIEYARTIQETMLPTKTELNGFFPNCMVFNRPRDIVSGDFYWFYQLDDNRALIAVADCTGHGVPGAIMSMMGHNYLNQAVLDCKLEKPSEILEFLDTKIGVAFQKEGSDEHGTDGMDIGICLMDKLNRTMFFSGARRPLTIVCPFESRDVAGIRRGIGEQYLCENLPFVDLEIPLKNQETYFLYSDGLQDQFGGEKSGKLMRKRLIPWLEKISKSPTEAQTTELQKLYEHWKGSNPQVDDICLLGFGA